MVPVDNFPRKQSMVPVDNFPRKQSMVPVDKGLQWVNVKQKKAT